MRTKQKRKKKQDKISRYLSLIPVYRDGVVAISLKKLFQSRGLALVQCEYQHSILSVHKNNEKKRNENKRTDGRTVKRRSWNVQNKRAIYSKHPSTHSFDSPHSTVNQDRQNSGEGEREVSFFSYALVMKKHPFPFTYVYVTFSTQSFLSFFFSCQPPG